MNHIPRNQKDIHEVAARLIAVLGRVGDRLDAWAAEPGRDARDVARMRASAKEARIIANIYEKKMAKIPRYVRSRCEVSPDGEVEAVETQWSEDGVTWGPWPWWETGDVA